MAAIDEVEGMTGALKDVVRLILWKWIEENGEKKVSLRIWIIRKTFRIKDLHSVFELLLGPRPIFVP